MSMFSKRPPNMSVLVIGPPRSDKQIFARSFLVDGFKGEEPGIYVLTNDFPEDVMVELKNLYKGNLLAKDLIRFIDCYTKYTGIIKPDTNYEIRVDGPTDLNRLSIAITKALNTFPKPRLVFDNVSTLLLHNSPESVEQFLGIAIGKFKANGVLSLLLMEEGVHSSQQVTTIEALTDYTIRFFAESKKKEALVSGRGTKKTVNYKLKGNKLIFEEEIL